MIEATDFVYNTYNTLDIMAMIAQSPARQIHNAYLDSPERSFARSDTAGDISEDVWGELR